MVSSTLPPLPVKISLPTREEMREMLARPSVIITAIICGTIVICLAIAGVVFLAYRGHDAMVVGTLLTGVMVGFGALMSARLRSVQDAVKDQRKE